MEICTIDAEGRPLPQGATGEICLKGAVVMSGYWRDAEATARVLRDGWFATGDVGYVDEEGFLFVVDRIKDIVNRGGEKISTAEVESCVSRLPAVAEVAGFALPDDDLGEVLEQSVLGRRTGRDLVSVTPVIDHMDLRRLRSRVEQRLRHVIVQRDQCIGLAVQQTGQSREGACCCASRFHHP